MSTTETFSFFSVLDKTNNRLVDDSYDTGPYTVDDTADGNSDGQTGIGGQVYSDYLGISFELAGTTTNGVVLNGNRYYYLFSNTSYSNGQSISINISDPYTYCFLENTGIKTPDGEQNVQSLKIGDKVLSADGRELTVRWMGHEKIINRIGASVHKAPVEINAGAFGDGLPHTDLYVSNSHAFLLDGHLVVASALINGDTITSVPFSDMPAEFTYWHIETDEHELVVANGVAAETLAGAPERRDFDNYEQYLAEFGADRIIPPMAYPRIKDVAQVPDSIAARFNLQRPSVDWNSLLDDESAGVLLKQSNG